MGGEKWITVSLWVLCIAGWSFVGRVDVSHLRSRWQPMSKPFMLPLMLSDSGSVVDTLGGQVQTAAPHQLPMGLLHLPLMELPPFSDCGRICACWSVQMFVKLPLHMLMHV